MRRALRFLRWFVPGVVAVLIWLQSVTSLPGWLASIAGDISKDDGEWIVRLALVVCGLIVALVALGPDRIRAVKEALTGGSHDPQPVAKPTDAARVELPAIQHPPISAATSGAFVPQVIDKQREELRRAAREELVAAIDDGQALFHPMFGAPHWGPYVIWCRKTVAFLETVFGSH